MRKHPWYKHVSLYIFIKTTPSSSSSEELLPWPLMISYPLQKKESTEMNRLSTLVTRQYRYEYLCRETRQKQSTQREKYEVRSRVESGEKRTPSRALPQAERTDAWIHSEISVWQELSGRVEWSNYSEMLVLNIQPKSLTGPRTRCWCSVRVGGSKVTSGAAIRGTTHATSQRVLNFLLRSIRRIREPERHFKSAFIDMSSWTGDLLFVAWWEGLPLREWGRGSRVGLQAWLPVWS